MDGFCVAIFLSFCFIIYMRKCFSHTCLLSLRFLRYISLQIGAMAAIHGRSYIHLATSLFPISFRSPHPKGVTEEGTLTYTDGVWKDQAGVTRTTWTTNKPNGDWTCPESQRSISGCGDFRTDTRNTTCTAMQVTVTVQATK